jgi:peptidoglycan/LPS O-acetylase OafA/YrhL
VKFIYNFTDISNIKRISFRHDINGLRAVAVLAVVFYHAEIKFFSAGFLGVDIFFVISGYLITNIIVSELNESTFKFSKFYIKRIKRILPALFSTLILSSVYVYLFFTPKVLIEYAKSLLPATLFYSNIYFSNLDFYNSEPAKVMPLIHTWSLAIEEQFYILFPLFIFLVFKYLKKYIFQVLIFIIIFSIYINKSTDSLDKFYLIEFRIWELLLGSVAMIVNQNIKKIKNLEIIGLFLMGFPIYYFDNSWITDLEPKLLTLAGVTIILIFNTKKSFLTRILSQKLISNIGLWSFSIYLFHQPIFSFFRIINGKNQAVSWVESTITKDFFYYLKLWAVILLVIFLSMLNYRLIEINFLEKFNRNRAIVLIITLITICSFAYLSLDTEGYKGRWIDNSLNQKALNFQQKENFDLIQNGEACHITDPDKIIEDVCVLNSNSTKPQIFLIGDSMARTIIKSASEQIKDHKITFITGDSCIFLIDIPNPRCKRSDREEIRKSLLGMENSIIIYVADLWEKIEDDPNEPESIKALNLVSTFPSTINYLSKNNQVILLTQIPTFRPNIPNLLLEGKDVVKISYQEWQNLDGVKILENIYRDLDQQNVSFVNVDEIFCNSFESNYCVGNTRDKIFYSDSKHLSIEGADLVVFEVIKVLNELNTK